MIVTIVENEDFETMIEVEEVAEIKLFGNHFHLRYKGKQLERYIPFNPKKAYIFIKEEEDE